MKTLTLAATALVLLSGAVHAQKYLGDLSANPYAPNSTSNPYGQYGSPYSPNSINNPYGQYGSRYSPTSPNNPYATNPPVIIQGPDGVPRIYSVPQRY